MKSAGTADFETDGRAENAVELLGGSACGSGCAGRKIFFLAGLYFFDRACYHINVIYVTEGRDGNADSSGAGKKPPVSRHRI